MKPKFFPLAITAVIAFSFVSAGSLRAQGFNLFDLFGLGDHERDHHPSAAQNKRLSDDVHNLDRLADQMVWTYGWELRQIHPCNCSIALYEHMKKHAQLTEDLSDASKGACRPTFARTARAVHESMRTMQNLRRTASVSQNIGNMITESGNLSSSLHSRTGLFTPEPSTPVTNPGYDQFGNQVAQINDLAGQLVNTYGWELNQTGHRCPCSIALLDQMQKYREQANNLERAYHGTCSTTFRNAARAVRESLTLVEQMAVKVNISDSVESLIERSCPLTTYVHNHSNQFQPLNTSYQPSYGSSGTGISPYYHSNHGRSKRHHN